MIRTNVRGIFICFAAAGLCGLLSLAPTWAKEYKPVGSVPTRPYRTLESPEAYRVDAALNEAIGAIRLEEIREDVEFLADDAMVGREAGSKEGKRTARFLMKQCVELGLQPAGENGTFVQTFANGRYQNVLALVEGSDPTARDELIMVCAHYDHLGLGTKANSRGPLGQIHNGADDNASGTAAVLAIAEALTTLDSKPKRSILFAFWDAEEKGMLGSRHWAAHPTEADRSIVAVLNLDMVGRLRNHRLMVFGARTGYGLRHLVAMENASVGLQLDYSWTLEDHADHFSFFRHRVPVLMFNTGLHDQFHTPYDDTEWINFAGLKRVTDLAFRTAVRLADRPNRIVFREKAGQENDLLRPRYAKKRFAYDGPPLRVGIFWDTDEADPHTIVLRHVTPKSPAARAGLKPGDRLFRVDGKTFENEDQFDAILSQPTEKVRIEAERDGKPFTTILQFRPVLEKTVGMN